MSADHSLRHAHEDARNEAALRVRALAGMEERARQQMLQRMARVLVQRPEPHVFHEAHVAPWRPWTERPDLPGHVDSTGFSDGIV